MLQSAVQTYEHQRCQARDLVSVFKLVRSPLIQEQALDNLLALFAALVRTNDKEFSALVSALVEPATAPTPEDQFALSMQALSTIAQCIVVLCINSDKNMEMTVSEFVQYRGYAFDRLAQVLVTCHIGRARSPFFSEWPYYSSYIDFGQVQRALGRGSLRCSVCNR
ncbi:MAG: hypothetical protein J3Q66DRAFT_175526 [Benniella sp.]|nr:MAG: hypothetical protein J3Q66DRAFT_175526 [Benniella sp.]